jgi:hypothetical protein
LLLGQRPGRHQITVKALNEAGIALPVVELDLVIEQQRLNPPLASRLSGAFHTVKHLL